MTDDKLVLIVDDDEDLREILSIVLEGHGYHTVEAADGLDALERLGTGIVPSLVLLDLRMPRMNGTEFLDALAATDSRGLPVVVITGDLGGASEALAAGARTCVGKPIDMEAMIEIVRLHAR